MIERENVGTLQAGGRNRKGLAWAALAVPAFLAGLPALALLVRVATTLPADAKVAGDPAVIELYTLRATTGAQLLGPYSRFGFHHPGPLLFYCLAPFYLAFGRNYAALCLGALVLNLAGLAGIAVIVSKQAGSVRRGLVLAALLSYMVYLQPEILVSAWNPDAAIVPLAFALVAFAAVMAGRTACLPWAVLAASVAAQSHLACAPPVACAALLWPVAAVIRRKWRHDAGGASISGGGRHAAAASLVGTLAWVPVVIEQLRDSPGNLTLIGRFLREPHESRPLGPTLVAVGDQVSAWLVGIFGVRSQAVPNPTLAALEGVVAVALLVLLVVGGLRSWKRRDAFALASCGSAILLFGVAVFVTRGVVGTLHPYLVRWVSAIGLLATIGAVIAFVPDRLPSVPNGLHAGIGTVLIVSLAFLGLRDAVRFPGLSRYIPSAWPDHVSPAALPALEARGVRRPHIRILTQGSWEQAAGLVLQITKARRTPSVDDRSVFMFGEPCRFQTADDGVVLMTDPGTAAQLATVPGVELLARSSEDTALFARTDRVPKRGVSLGTWEAEIYLRGGFSWPENPPEGRFRWSDGAVSRLVLPAVPGLPHRLTVEAAPMAVPGKHQAITMSFNGIPFPTAGMKPGWASYAFSIPGHLVKARNLVSFRYAYATSPFELSGNGDRRKLAVAFRTISLSEETTGGLPRQRRAYRGAQTVATATARSTARSRRGAGGSSPRAPRRACVRSSAR